MAEDLTAENYVEKTKEGNVVVDFWASWCGPCKVMKPEFEAAAEEVKNVAFFKLEVDGAQDIAGKMGIRGVPTVIFFKDGKEVHRFSGAKSKQAIIDEVKGVFE